MTTGRVLCLAGRGSLRARPGHATLSVSASASHAPLAASGTASLHTGPFSAASLARIHRSNGSSTSTSICCHHRDGKHLLSTAGISNYNSSSSSSSGYPAGNETKPLKPPSAVVAEYWDDVMKYSHQPDDYTLGHASDGHAAGDAAAKIQPDETAVRQLLMGVIKAKREQGDIWPCLLTRQCCEFYEGLDMAGRTKFLCVLGRDFDIDLQDTASAVTQFEESMSKSDRSVIRSSQRLRLVLTPAYLTFFSRINQLPGGMAFLVHLREDILKILATNGNDLHLRALNDALKAKLQEWFSMGFLDLERITWHSPANILEKIVRYEAVHEIPSWQALKQRLGPGRLCYSFFHRSMPQDPLTFVQVALVQDISDQVQAILHDKSPDVKDPKAAIFYSITSSQRGLSGVDLGNFLIKRVVKEIQLNFPSITTFCTLSPIPGFRAWLATAIANEIQHPPPDASGSLLLPQEADALRAFAPSQAPIQTLSTVSGDAAWLESADQSRVFQPIIERLCSRYLTMEKKRALALDPVANFHIRNGASIYRLNWAGDTSDKGIRQSFGMMVNYIYDLPEIEANNQKYLLDGQITFWDPVHPSLEWAQTQTAITPPTPPHDFSSKL
ncbi:malonyl-CoA decarboxylase-domain-containing protein [Entophlyctis helioformis]|nr:malonyl-CoA decarboxylase-domain-containing protein [Entophlyctis helioformis]